MFLRLVDRFPRWCSYSLSDIFSHYKFNYHDASKTLKDKVGDPSPQMQGRVPIVGKASFSLDFIVIQEAQSSI